MTKGRRVARPGNRLAQIKAQNREDNIHWYHCARPKRPGRVTHGLPRETVKPLASSADAVLPSNQPPGLSF